MTKESTLMTEMSLLHTLYDTASKTDQGKIRVVFDQYKNYLSESPDRESYFSNAVQGITAKDLIQKLKSDWKNSPSTSSDDVLNNAKNALKNLLEPFPIRSEKALTPREPRPVGSMLWSRC